MLGIWPRFYVLVEKGDCEVVVLDVAPHSDGRAGLGLSEPHEGDDSEEDDGRHDEGFLIHGAV